MEVLHHETPSEVSPQVEGEDFISSMPEDVIADIMNRLPLRDAVRTSILSTNWRFKWTLLTQLIMDFKFFNMLGRRTIHFDKTNKRGLLHQLKGAITTIVLHIPDYMKLAAEDIHHLFMFLSRIRGFKELTLLNFNETPVLLPSHLFSCLDLKHLNLENCVLSPMPDLCGFPKLLSLELFNVRIQGHRYGELISQCPLLEYVEILSGEVGREVKLVEITKLENLKKLLLSLALLDNMSMVRLSTVFQHLSLLPKLQELYLDFGKCEFLQEDVAQSPVCTNFPFLKDLTLCDIDFSTHSMLSCAFGMLFGCANLQTLHITAAYEKAVHPPAIISPELNPNTMGQLQLWKVELENIKGLENEVCLIKYMLAYSPMLKSLVIKCNPSIESDDSEKDKLASSLLKLHRASPMVEIIF